MRIHVSRVAEETDEDKLSRSMNAQSSSSGEDSLSLAGQVEHESHTHTRKLPRPMAKEALAQAGGRDRSAGDATVFPRYT